MRLFSFFCKLLYSYALLSPPNGVDNGKLQQRQEDKAGAGEEPDVDELDIVDLGQLVRAGAPGECDQGEPGGGAQGRPARHRVGVQPEADPGHADQQQRGDIVLQDVLTNLTAQYKVHHQSAKVTI